MFSDAFAMLVCGCRTVLVVREKLPSMADTCTTWRCRAGPAVSSGRRREVSRNGANALTTCAESHSCGLTSASRRVHELTGRRSSWCPVSSTSPAGKNVSSSAEPISGGDPVAARSSR